MKQKTKQNNDNKNPVRYGEEQANQAQKRFYKHSHTI